MLSKTCTCVVVLACGVLAGLASWAEGRQGDKPGLSGAWGKKDGELKLVFADKGVLKIAPHGDSALIDIVCSYTVEKGGRVKAKITGFEGKEEAKKKAQEVLPVGSQFSFRWQAKGDAASLGDLKGDDVEKLKSHLEGDYERKK